MTIIIEKVYYEDYLKIIIKREYLKINIKKDYYDDYYK